ncbi:MAG: IclR family transcriptional regulator [Pseudomonadota bacterium]
MTDRIPTNLRTLLICEVIGKSDHALTPTEINQDIGLPKQTIHRLISTLVNEGFLIRDKDRNKYRPSRRLRLIGAGLLHASRSNIMRHQILQQVAAEIGEAVNFVVPEETGMNYLDRVETDWPFRIQLPRGSNVPFHLTASGKTFMASLKPKHRQRFVESLDLQPTTGNSFTQKEALLSELSGVAKQGYALDREEFIDGLVAVAVPVLDSANRFVAALATHGPKDRLKPDALPDIAVLLKGYSEKLTEVILD